jgi:mycothiol system anti-sigma-R factor
MSCGSPHQTPCVEVLQHIYAYIDGEVDGPVEVSITTHLRECPPCLQHFAVERAVKGLVRRSCACEQAPEELRTQIVTKIRQITITYGE